jgi:ketosteroid isomerase-like protein
MSANLDLVEMSVYDCFTFRDGKVTRHRLYSDGANALAAIGLTE